MDLLQTVRKEGSRGGRDEFKWSDVQNSQHRENYLGHSVMAPVGRWQKGRDLNWYSKTDGATPDESGRTPGEIERDARKEEIRKIKEAEEDARCKALGLPIPDRDNPNLQALPEGMEKRRRIGPAAMPEVEGRKEKRRHRDKSRDRDYRRKHRDRSREDRAGDRHKRSHRRQVSRTRSSSRDGRRETDRSRPRSRSRDRREERKQIERRSTRDRSVSDRRQVRERSRSRSPYTSREQDDKRRRSRSRSRD